MNIGLFDVDGYPNLALMRLSSFYKNDGHNVSLNFQLGQFDKTFASCIFTWNKRKALSLPFDNIEIGGPGYDLKTNLAVEVESCRPDYALYNLKHGLGFISRGCIRKCKFCIVPEKEGYIRQVAKIEDLINPLSNHLVLMDNNFLALPNCIEILNEMAERNLRVDFNQGLDIRLINENTALALSKVKPLKQWRFSFDDIASESSFRKGMDILSMFVRPTSIMIFMLVGYNSNWKEDFERAKIIREYNCDVFFMLYKDRDGKSNLGTWDDMPEKFCREILKIRSPRGNAKKIARLFMRPAATKKIVESYKKMAL